MRRYSNSKSEAQLRGGSVAEASLHSSGAPEDSAEWLHQDCHRSRTHCMHAVQREILKRMHAQVPE